MAEYAMVTALEDGPVRLLRCPKTPGLSLRHGSTEIGGLQRTERRTWECWRVYPDGYHWYEDEDVLAVIMRLWEMRHAD